MAPINRFEFGKRKGEERKVKDCKDVQRVSEAKEEDVLRSFPPCSGGRTKSTHGNEFKRRRRRGN